MEGESLVLGNTASSCELASTRGDLCIIVLSGQNIPDKVCVCLLEYVDAWIP